MFAIRQQKIFLHDIRFYLYVALGTLTVLVFISLGLTWFGTSEQVNVSTTLTYAGRERSLTQKVFAESLQMVYAPTASAKKMLTIDEADWTARHDAIWRGDNSLHVLSVSNYPSILPKVNRVESTYLEMHIAIDGVLASHDKDILSRDIAVITKDATPFYNAMEEYNTYLRNLTAQYQTMILLYGVCSTAAILLVLALAVLAVFRPAFKRIDSTFLSLAEANALLDHQREETSFLLEEIRRADHDTRIPAVKVSEGIYAVQSGSNGHFIVKKIEGLFMCPCKIYQLNHYCNHVKHALYAEQHRDITSQQLPPLASRR